MAVSGDLATTFSEADLYSLRATVAAHGSALGLAEPGLGNLLIVATELATNAIRHGGAATGELRLWVADQVLYCQVSDDGPGIADPDRAGVTPVSLNSDGGRGLWIVRQLVDEMIIADRRPGTTVTVAFRIGT